jgi:hypothetical protein
MKNLNSFLDSLTEIEKQHVRRSLRVEEEQINCKNLNDELKLYVLKAAFKKYELEELMEKLDIKYNEF